MRKLLVLTRVQLRALLAALHVGRTNRRRPVSVWLSIVLVGLLCLYISGVYSFGLGAQLAQVGALELLLALIPGMAVVGGTMLTAFAAQGVVFGGRDGDLLLSMPVPAVTVLLSKLAALYVENLVISALLLLPAGAAWLWYGGSGGVLTLLRLAAGAVFLALLPTALALLAGFLLSWLGGRFANRKLVNLLLYALLLAAVLGLSVQVSRGVSSLAAGTGALDGGLWGVPLRLFQRGVCGDWETLFLFGLLSLVPVLAEAALLSRFYRQVLTGLRSHGRRPAYRLTRLKGSGPWRALVKKEAARYFGTPIYLFNTSLGLILLAAGGVAAAVMGGRVRAMLPGDAPLLSLAAAVVGFSLATVNITASSISLEGQNLWILREAPLSPGMIFSAKVGFQLALTLPCLGVGTAGLAWGLGLSAPEGAALLCAGGAFACFAALLGLAVNLRLPKLDAVNDMVVVKMSAAALVSLLGAAAAAVGCGALVWLGRRVWSEAACLALCALALLAGCAVLLRWLGGRGAARFRAL